MFVKSDEQSYEIVCFVMRGKKLRISSEDEAKEEIIGLAGEASVSFFSSKFAIFLSLITNYIFHNEYLKLTLFSTIVYILNFITHVNACVMKYLLFVTHVKALKMKAFLVRELRRNKVDFRYVLWKIKIENAKWI